MTETKYLYGASVQGIQAFIFQTNELKDIVGASELVENICTRMFNPYGDRGKIVVNAAGNVKFYDAEKGQSVSIRFVDGHYIVKEFSVKAVDLKGSDHVIPKVYLAQRMPGTRSFIPIVPLFSHQWQIYDFFFKVVYLP